MNIKNFTSYCGSSAVSSLRSYGKLWIIIIILSALLQSCKKQPEPFSLNSSIIYTANGTEVAGNPRGSITIVEFFDYRCHICRETATSLNTLIQIDPQLRVVYKELPILGDASLYASTVALAAYYQYKYLTVHDALLRSDALNSELDILTIVKKPGLDLQQLLADMNKPEISQRLFENRELATKLGIQATPAFVIAMTTWSDDKLIATGGMVVVGGMSLEDFKKLLVKVRLQE